MKSALEQITNVPEKWSVDLQGWNSTAPIFEKLISELKPKRIIEVGSWKGASALHMASLTKDTGACIYCVDTWLGGVDHLMSDLPQDHIPKLEGYPQLYYQFLHNVKESGFGDRIFPVPASSSAAAVYLKEKGIRAELIYIDGDHTTPGCLLDILLYQECLSEGGVMFGDDYGFPTVAAAVQQYLAKRPNKQGFVEDSGHWIIK